MTPTAGRWQSRSGRPWAVSFSRCCRVEDEREGDGMDNPPGTSPRTLARFGGALYLIVIVLGIFQESVVRARIGVSGDAAATARNLHSMDSLWRLGIAAELVLLVSALALAVIFYILLRPVSRDLSLLAMAFNLVSISIEAAV